MLLLSEFIEDEVFLLEFADKSIREDREIALMAIKSDIDALKYIDSSFRSDREIIIKAIEHNGEILKYADSSLRRDKEVVLKAMETADILEYVDESIRAEIVNEVLQKDGIGLKYATKEQQADKALVLKAIKHNAESLEYISDEFRSDMDIAMMALYASRYSYETNIFAYLDEKILKDREFMLLAHKYEEGFSYAHKELKRDKSFVLEALGSVYKGQLYPITLDYEKIILSMDKSLRADRDVMLLAIKQIFDDTFNYIDKSLKKDKDFLIEVLKEIYIWDKVDDEILKDNDFIVRAIKETGCGLEYASPEQQDSEELVLLSAVDNGWELYALEDASVRLKRDKKLILNILKMGTSNSLKYIDDTLKKEQSFITQCIELSGVGMEYATDKQKNDRDFVLEATKKYPLAFTHADERFRQDREIILEATKKYPLAFNHADERFKQDREIIVEAIKKDGYAFVYTDNKFNSDREMILEAIKTSDRVWDYLSSEIETISFDLMEDKSFVMEALRIRPTIYTFLSSKFQRDRDIWALMDELGAENSGLSIYKYILPLCEEYGVDIEG